MATITAVLRPDGVTVDITATLAAAEYVPGSTISVQRLRPDFSVDAVLATWTRAGTAIQVTNLVDAMAPLQTASYWRLIAQEPSSPPVVVTTSSSVTPDAAGCWLTYGPYPHTVLPVEVQAWPTDQLAPRESEHRIVLRPDVVVLQDVWDLSAGDLTFLVRDLESLRSLTAALTSTGTVLLRTQPDSMIVNDAADGTFWFTVGRVDRARMSGRSPDGRRLVTVGTRGSVPFSPYAASSSTTLGQLAAKGATLADVAALGTTLADLAALGP